MYNNIKYRTRADQKRVGCWTPLICCDGKIGTRTFLPIVLQRYFWKGWGGVSKIAANAHSDLMITRSISLQEPWTFPVRTHSFSPFHYLTVGSVWAYVAYAARYHKLTHSFSPVQYSIYNGHFFLDGLFQVSKLASKEKLAFGKKMST